MIPGLDGLRAVAYLFIFFYHARYLDVGWIGVQFFFVLSGFLITSILLEMKNSLPVGGYFLKFYGRRFLRIFPLYYFYLLLAGGVTTWLISISYRTGYMELFREQVRYAVFYVYNFLLATSARDPSFMLEHLWSLSVEEQFYIIWPILILLTPERLKKGLFLVLIGLGPVFRIGFMFFHASEGNLIFQPGVPQALHSLPFTHMDSFAFGAYASSYGIPRARRQFFVLFWLVPLIGFATQYIVSGGFGTFSSFGYPPHMSGGYQFIWGYLLLNYFFAVTIQAVAREGLFNRFLDWAPMRYLGKISYGLYVYHQPITWFAFEVRELGLDAGTTQLIASVIAFFGTLLVASASYHFMEKPLLNLKDRFFPIGPKNAR
jgi:peptidoglycan/LPS O-acetylase OafA/YrhL